MADAPHAEPDSWTPSRSARKPGGPDSPDPANLGGLLRQAAEGNAQAWRRLVESYTTRVYGLLVRQCRDRELAEEITQATFVTVVEKLACFSGYEERGRFEPWLFRIAMNKLRDEMRRRKRQAVSIDFHSRPTDGTNPAAMEQLVATKSLSIPNPLESASQAEQINRLREAIKTLSEADQQVLQLRHTAGLSFPKIAKVLDEPIGTVLARSHRALGKLRNKLRETEQDT